MKSSSFPMAEGGEELEEGLPEDQTSWVPAFQSFPLKPKARRLKPASKERQGEARACDWKRVRKKRETRAESRSIVRREGKIERRMRSRREVRTTRSERSSVGISRDALADFAPEYF